jgi:tetratricopeptide (TPR) repeat protein
MVLPTLLAGLVLAGGCSHGGGTVIQDGTAVPHYRGMSGHHYPVTTASPMAQQYFDQGLVWAYAFNHDEAIRSFEAATVLDPGCAMAWWGIALCNGPHINNPAVPEERSQAATAALSKALALVESCTPKEKALIDALTKRYSDPPAADRGPLDKAYADAMGQVWEAHRDDPEIGTMYAESLMDLRPWNLWKEDGEPQPGTEKIIAVLEAVMAKAPSNPGANHLYIHVVEASPNPRKAMGAADRLRDMVPASSHLVHMPSHIDVLTGQWEQASVQNEKAIRIDRNYEKISPKQAFYRVYMVHNHHMLSFASMMEGRSRRAIESARELVTSIPPAFLKENAAMMDPYTGAIYDALKRFGRWDEILAEPAPPENLVITTAMWRFTRGLAFAALGRVPEAEQERTAFEAAVAKVPEDAILAINPARTVLKIAEHMLNGEIEFRRGNHDGAIDQLTKAIAIEDGLRYMEPPEWVQPIRHTLGAVLLDAGRPAEAEKVYQEDLKNWPHNGWSMYGLSRCLRARGAGEEAEAIEARFKKAWSRADTPIASSCLCVPKT